MELALVTKVTAAVDTVPAHVWLAPLDPQVEDIAVPAAVFSRDWHVSTVYQARARGLSLIALAASHQRPPSCASCRSSERDAQRWLDRCTNRHENPAVQKRFTAAAGNTIKQSVMTPDAAKKRHQNERQRVSRLARAEMNTAAFALRRVKGLALDQVRTAICSWQNTRAHTTACRRAAARRHRHCWA